MALGRATDDRSLLGSANPLLVLSWPCELESHLNPTSWSMSQYLRYGTDSERHRFMAPSLHLLILIPHMFTDLLIHLFKINGVPFYVPGIVNNVRQRNVNETQPALVSRIPQTSRKM